MKLKVCGITRPEQARELVALCADHIGVILYEKSPRFVTLDGAREVRNSIDSSSMVAVFVNATVDDMVHARAHVGFDVVQLHGTESADDVQRVRDRMQGIVVWKALRVAEASERKAVCDFAHCADLILLDSGSLGGGVFGGTGKKFDWSLLRSVPPDARYALSGGIGPADAAAVRALSDSYPCIQCVDVNSGFEISPGVKDVVKVQRFARGIAT